MPDDLMRDVLELTKPYFPGALLDRLRQLFERFPPTLPVFKQIKQENDQAILEVGYHTEDLAVDYTFGLQKETVGVVRLGDVLGVSVSITESATTVTFRTASLANAFQYIASVEQYRKDLERYAEHIQRSLAT